jgi:hypothetical protein
VPEIGRPIFIPSLRLPLAPSQRSFLSRHLPFNRREKVLRRFVVAANVEAGDAEVVDCSGEGRAEVQSATVRGNGFFWETAVGERGAETVPEEEVLLERRGNGRREKGRQRNEGVGKVEKQRLEGEERRRRVSSAGGRAGNRETDRRPNAQRRLEAISRPLIIRVTVEQHTQSNLHIRIHLCSPSRNFIALSRSASHRSCASGREEEVDDSVRGVPGRGLRSCSGWSRDGGVGEGEPALESGEGAEFLAFVHIGDGEGLLRRRGSGDGKETVSRDLER